MAIIKHFKSGTVSDLLSIFPACRMRRMEGKEKKNPKF